MFVLEVLLLVSSYSAAASIDEDFSSLCPLKIPLHNQTYKCEPVPTECLYRPPIMKIVGSGGTEAEPQTYPYMAALGYGPKTNIAWLCGGTLVNERFVLTAAHCLHSFDLGDVQWVRLGDLDLNATWDDAKPQDFFVAATYPYPEFKRPLHYHDIALLKLDHKAVFDDYVRPVCLHFKHNLTAGSRLWAPGWGDLSFYGDKTTHLMKVDLRLISYENCSTRFRQESTRRLSDGIRDDIQICAGNTKGRDTCPGDSGGPLIIESTNRIIGITSFGKACGIDNTLGVYTRVSYYVPWIDSVVQNKTEALSQDLRDILIFQ